jgi:parvulin-like peptidyl-prolyl isomerase
MTEEELQNAKKIAEKALDMVKAGDDFETIVASDKNITTNDLKVVNADQTIASEYKEAAIALAVGAYSDIVETSSGYYIIQLVDNTSTESYDAAVTDAITTAESEGFNKEFESLKSGYDITIEQEVWDTIIIGETTKTPDSIQDTESIQTPATTQE